MKRYKPMHPRKRLLKIIADNEQFIRDVEWWNTNRTDAEPMDCEVEKVVLSIARPCLAALDRGDNEAFNRLCVRLVQYAEQEMT